MFQMDKLKTILFEMKKKPFFVPLVFIILGIVLISLFSFETEKPKTISKELDPYEYAEDLENKLSKRIKEFSGVEDCSVMITLSSVENNEYLENSSVSSTMDKENEQYSRQKEYLVIDENGNDTVIVSSKKMPKVCGALVVYQGIDDVEIQKNILDSVSTLLGIQSNKVCVVAEQT